MVQPARTPRPSRDATSSRQPSGSCQEGVTFPLGFLTVLSLHHGKQEASPFLLELVTVVIIL